MIDFGNIITVENPILDIPLLYTESINIDISDVFDLASGANFDITLEDGYSSNPDIATATLSVNTITVTAGSTTGITEITVTASTGVGATTETFTVLVNDPTGPTYSDDFESGIFSDDWNFSGFGNHWEVVATTGDDGAYIAKSGSTNNNFSTSLIISKEFLSTSYVTFEYKTSSQENFDFLKFYIDGTLVEKWSGETDWNEFSYLLEAGTYDIEWKYEKNNSGTAGEDCVWIDNVFFGGLPVVGIDELETSSVANFELAQNYPNPFNPTTSISFSLLSNSKVSLVVFDATGKEVSSLINGELRSGLHQVGFNAAEMVSGVYYYTLMINNKSVTKKMMLLK